MENQDDYYRHGSAYYKGHCTECGNPTGTNYDELCPICLASAESVIKCPGCGFEVEKEDFNTEHNLCDYCVEQLAEEKSNKVNLQIDMRDFANELLKDIYSITKTYKK